MKGRQQHWFLAGGIGIRKWHVEGMILDNQILKNNQNLHNNSDLSKLSKRLKLLSRQSIIHNN